MAAEGPLYIGFDLSTQQLKAIVIDSSLAVTAEAKVDFDADFSPVYPITKGVIAPAGTGEVYAPMAMWLEALDLVLRRLRAAGPEGMMGRVRAVSGSCQQHGSVFWARGAERLLEGLRGDGGRGGIGSGGGGGSGEGLKDRLAERGAFAYAYAPNWQDSSTQAECDKFEAAVGGKERLAEITGSSAHYRFTGPQILRLRKTKPDTYTATWRISLVSSFLASVLLGAVAPLDLSDACGMNLWNILTQNWDPTLLSLVAGSPADAPALAVRLGPVRTDGGGSLGSIASYFTHAYGFDPACQVAPFTGDNPATLLALPLRPGDVVVSLGTSTTFLAVTPHYKPDPAYHFFNHPAIPGQYMFMLCYKNGGLARETVRNGLREEGDGLAAAWERFNDAVLASAPLGLESGEDDNNEDDVDDRRVKIGLYFDLPEIVPNAPAGTWRFTCTRDGADLRPHNPDGDAPWTSHDDARAILESQCLSMRLRSQDLIDVPPKTPGLPAQPRRIYLAGGGSVNPVVARVVGEVLGGIEGVYNLDVGGNACALGGAHKALWSVERGGDAGRGGGKRFDELIGERWVEEGRVERAARGYVRGVFEAYGRVLGAFGEMEKRVLVEARGRK